MGRSPGTYGSTFEESWRAKPGQFRSDSPDLCTYRLFSIAEVRAAMSGDGVAIPSPPPAASSHSGGGRERRHLGTLGMACLVFLLIAIGFSPIPAAAVGGSAPTGCTPGWQKVAQFDNSFLWTDGGVLPVDSAHWQGFVRLFEQVDADCYVVGVSLRYTGPLSGGSLILTGSPAVSFTVQHPSPFSQYANVGVNAYGELASWNPPAGGHITYSVSTNFGINPRGADEFVINGLGVPATVTNIRAFFTLPLDFVGKTIVAQIHVGPNKCLCKTTSIGVPGPTRPPADTTPPARVTDLAAASAGTDHVLLVWTAPGDDGMSGQASQYDIRYSTAGPLTDANFTQGTAFPAPAPASPGTSESLDGTGLAASTHYWFGLPTADEVPNWSPVSNSPAAVTSAPPPPPPPPQKTWEIGRASCRERV